MNEFLNECKPLGQEPGRVYLKGRVGQGFARPSQCNLLSEVPDEDLRANSKIVVGDGMFKGTSYG